MNVKNARVIVGVILSLIIVVPLTITGVFFLNPANAGKVLPGVTVMGIDLSNLDKKESVAKIAAYKDDLYATNVKVKYLDQSYSLPVSEIGLDLNEENIVDEAMHIGRNGSLVKQWKDRQQMKESGVDFNPPLNIDREKVIQITGEFTQSISEEPVDANFVVDGNDNVTISPGKDGQEVDLDKMMEDLSGAIMVGNSPEIELALITVSPERTTEALTESGVNGVLGGYFTNFNQSQVNRTYNIRLAAGAYDGLLVQPGEVVSFNKTVGPRSISAGYRNAPVIVNNELVEGIGGGVCQVSSTLYNSVLLAGLEIVERTCHALQVSYVPIGRDATVVDDALDFVFRNNTKNYIYIKAFVNGGRLTIKIYGNMADKKEVQVNSWVTQVISPDVVYEDDPNLPKGEEVVLEGGASGYRAAAERLFLINGIVERRETLGSSSYHAQKRVVAVGTSNEIHAPINPVITPPATNETNNSAPSSGGSQGTDGNTSTGDGAADAGNNGIEGATNNGISNAGNGSGGTTGKVDNSTDDRENWQVNPAIPIPKPTAD